MKFKIQNSKVKIMVMLFIAALGSSAFGAAITKSTAAEFSASGAVFENTEVSGDTVVLTYGPDILWTANGVRVNQTAGSVLDIYGYDGDDPLQNGMDIATDGAGGIYVAWVNLSEDVCLARVDASGARAWEKTIASGSAIRPKITAAFTSKTGEFNGVIVAWEQGDGGDPGNIWAAKYDPDGNPLWSEVVCDFSLKQHEVYLVGGTAGDAIMVWVDERDSVEGGDPKWAVYAQWMGASGTPVWAEDGVVVRPSDIKNLSHPSIVALREGINEGFIVAWLEKRSDEDDLYATHLFLNGSTDEDNFGPAGRAVSGSSARKTDYAMANSLSVNRAIFAWPEGDEHTVGRDIYAQAISTAGERLWGNPEAGTGVALSTAAGDQSLALVAALPEGETYFSWINASDFDSYVQRLSASGVKQFGEAGKNVGRPTILSLAHDGAGGVFGGAAMGDTINTMIPYLQRLGYNGNELWEGLQLSSSHAVRTEGLGKVIASEDRGAIVVWMTQDSEEKNDIYVQKGTERYDASGYYTTEKMQAPGWYSWDTIEWTASSQGLAAAAEAGAISAQVKTAASEAALDEADYVSVENNGSIPGPSNGPWIQARFTLSSSVDKFYTSALDTVSFNFKTYSTDTVDPKIDSVIIGEAILTDPLKVYPVSRFPTVKVIVSDNERVEDVYIKLDGSKVVDYTTLRSEDTLREVEAGLALAEGDHAMEIGVIDVANNLTSATFNLNVSTVTGFEQASVVAAQSASGNEILIGYTLSADSPVKASIWDASGNQVWSSSSDEEGGLEGSAGPHTLNVSAGHLPNGVYYLYITSGGTTVKRKFKLER